MWISEMAARSSRESGSAVQTGTVTIGGDMASAMLSGEARGLGILAPGGIRWLPEAGQDALIVCSEEGERFIAGIPFDTGEGLQAGEVYIMSNVKCPAVLVECAFLSDPQDCALLRTAEHRKKIAAILLASCLQYTEAKYEGQDDILLHGVRQ